MIFTNVKNIVFFKPTEGKNVHLQLTPTLKRTNQGSKSGHLCPGLVEFPMHWSWRVSRSYLSIRAGVVALSAGPLALGGSGWPDAWHSRLGLAASPACGQPRTLSRHFVAGCHRYKGSGNLDTRVSNRHHQSFITREYINYKQICPLLS